MSEQTRIALRHMSAVELDALHNRVKTSLLAAGIKPDALDEAIAAAIVPQLELIEQDRATQQAKRDTEIARRSHLRVVK